MSKRLKKILYYNIVRYDLMYKLKWLEFWTNHISLFYYKVLVSLFSFLLNSLDLIFNTLLIVFKIFSCSTIILYLIFTLYTFFKINNILSNINFYFTGLINLIIIRFKFFITVYIDRLFTFIRSVYTLLLRAWDKVWVKITCVAIILTKRINYAKLLAQYNIIFNNPFLYTGYYINKLNFRILNSIFLINYSKQVLNSLNFFTLIFYRSFLKFYFKQNMVCDLLRNLINFYSVHIYVIYRLKNYKVLKLRFFFSFYPYKFHFIINKRYNTLIY